MADALPGAAAPLITADLAAPPTQAQDGAAPSPLALLRLLDGWMSSSNMDDGHPWRLAIARTLAAAPAGVAEVDLVRRAGEVLFSQIEICADGLRELIEESQGDMRHAMPMRAAVGQIGWIASQGLRLTGLRSFNDDASHWLLYPSQRDAIKAAGGAAS